MKFFIKYKSKIISLFLLSATVLNIIQPMTVRGIEFSSSLGTQAALGSPLLNESTWSSDDWNKWETVAFGVFLSNFPIPFVDDYASAFQSKSTNGSKGNALNALKYGTGNDSQANKVLENLLGYAVSDQSQQLANIKVRYHKIDGYLNDSLTGGIQDDGVEAKLSDMFIDLTDSSASNTNKPYIVYGTNKIDIMSNYSNASNVNDARIYSMKYFEELYLPEFYITVNGKPVTILDFRDGYDLQMFSLSLARAANSDFGEAVMATVEALKDRIIGLDPYGNICTNLDGRNVIVFPASSNQHITREKQYNLLTSNFLIGSYISKNGDSLVNSIGSYRFHLLGTELEFSSGDTLAKSSEDNSDLGRVIMYSDTDTSLYQYLKSKVNSTTTFKDVVSSYMNDLASNKDSFSRGNAIYEIVNAGMKEDRFSMPFKVDVVGAEGSLGLGAKIFRGVDNANSAGSVIVHDAVVASSLLANIYPTKTGTNVMNYMFTLSGKANLFSNSDRQYLAAGGTYKATKDDAFIRYANYALKYLDNSVVRNVSGTSNYSVPTQDEFATRVKSSGNFDELAQAIYSSVSPVNGDRMTQDMPLSGLFKHWLVNESGYKKGNEYTVDKVTNMKAKDLFSKNFFYNLGSAITGIEQIDDMQSSFYRVASLYGFNSSAIAASNVLNVVEGTEFATYTPYIYLSYLDFYGVLDGKSNFNEEMFKGDIMARTGEEIADGAVLDEETKKELMQEYMYSLLDPADKSGYRQRLVNNFITEFLYDNYIKLADVSGNISGSNNSTNTNEHIRTQLNGKDAGVLSVNSLSENMFIGFMVRAYIRNFSIIYAIVLIFSLIVAILGRGGIIKIFLVTIGFSFILSLSPAMADIVPIVSNRFVQNLFRDHMTYWAIAESIENSNADRKAIENLSDSSGVDAKELNSFIRMLNLVQYDKTILIKNDISKKVVENISSVDLNNLQRLRTARWMIPALIRQFSASDGSADYVSVTLNDTYRNIHNLYWLYRNSKTGGDKIKNDLTVSDSYDSILANEVGVGTIGGVSNSADILELSDKQSIFGGYQNTRGSSNTVDYHAVNRFNNQDNENLHTSFYLMNFGTRFKVPNPSDFSYVAEEVNKAGLNKDSWDTYAKYLIANKSSLGFMSSLVSITDADVIPTLGSYNSYHLPIYNYFGYLLMTENPLPYLYINLKDTFNPDMSIGKLVYELQGYYTELLDANGNPVGTRIHHTFMRDGSNGGIRDFLDMEEFFTNVLPYMYNVQIIAGGDGNNNGAFGDSIIGDGYSIYKDNKKDWMYRSNWVTKIEEGELYNQKSRIGYIADDGSKKFVDIKGSLHPSNYEKYRPMVFSEAQMLEMGLVESDLSFTESKILKLNKAVERKWLTMINYANTTGMKADILYKQMALEALLLFNKEFSVNTIQEGKGLYPYTLDIRNISFDNIMKLMYLGATGNSSIIYDDTMKHILTYGDFFSSLLLLLNVILCSKVIPIIRDFSIGFVTVILFAKLLMDMVTFGNRNKQFLLGALIIYIKSTVFVLLYFLMFRFLISVSQPSTVLHLTRDSGRYNSVWWYNIVILATSCLYVYLVGWHIIKFTWVNRADLGLEVSLNQFSFAYNVAKNGVSSALDKVKGYGSKSYGYGADYASKAYDYGAGALDMVNSGINKAGDFVSDNLKYSLYRKDKSSKSSESSSGSSDSYDSSYNEYLNNLYDINNASYYGDVSYRVDNNTVNDINSSIDRGSDNLRQYQSKKDKS